jgi:hypothetical protein
VGAAQGQSVGGKAVTGVCRRAAIEGEVREGQYFERRLGNGLEAMLEPLASGWILRVLPYGEARGPHDYAELATPPYQSVNPLLISTDFSFRAQDVVAWNPRRFRYAASVEEFRRLSAQYEQYRKAGSSPAAEAQLAELAERAPEGTLRILDARLVPGTANQAQTAALVATHLESTAHSVEQPMKGNDMPLGRVTWLRFRIEFAVPVGFRVEHGVGIAQIACR